MICCAARKIRTRPTKWISRAAQHTINCDRTLPRNALKDVPLKKTVRRQTRLYLEGFVLKIQGERFRNSTGRRSESTISYAGR